MDKIRNFCIIAHIDHGKSTLADRMLELTGTVEKRKMKAQLLDQMDLERERGITIKLQPVRMEYEYRDGEAGGRQRAGLSETKLGSARERRKGGELPSEIYEFNLIDTPGHVDFSYEVSRSLAACEGALLVVDAAQGIEAQTLANLHLAVQQGLTIIPVINKIDLPNADTEKVKKEILSILNINEDEIILASAKTGEGVTEILKAVIERMPAPVSPLAEQAKSAKSDRSSSDDERSRKPFRSLIFDSQYSSYQGAIAYVRVVDGEVKAGDKVNFLATKKGSEVLEVGVFKPVRTKVDKLSAGEIGYVVTGLKSLEDVRVGDTLAKGQVKPLAGYKKVTPFIYAGVYSTVGEDATKLREALEKLSLNDSSLEFQPEKSSILGTGFRVGFLGLLHMDIVEQRLEREFDLDLVMTTPNVQHKVILNNNEEKFVDSPEDLPDPSAYKELQEPWVSLEIILPTRYIGAVMELLQNRRGIYKTTDYLDKERAVLKYEAPLRGVVIDFYDHFKSVTSGYGSMSYAPIGFHSGDLVRLDILIADKKIGTLSQIVHKSEAYREGREITARLRSLIPRQLFEVKIQAAVGAKVLASEKISAMRKDVTAKLYGGDRTRKDKLLKKQKEGKKRMKSIGGVSVPTEIFVKLMQR